MEEHPIIITLRSDGTTAVVFHPTHQADVAEELTDALGSVSEDERGGYVYPVRPLKRWAFKALRKTFGSSGSVAEWTRHWRGHWIVIRADNGVRLPGVFPSHQAAVEAEVAYILEECIHQ